VHDQEEPDQARWSYILYLLAKARISFEKQQIPFFISLKKLANFAKISIFLIVPIEHFATALFFCFLIMGKFRGTAS